MVVLPPVKAASLMACAVSLLNPEKVVMFIRVPSCAIAAVGLNIPSFSTVTACMPNPNASVTALSPNIDFTQALPNTSLKIWFSILSAPLGNPTTLPMKLLRISW